MMNWRLFWHPFSGTRRLFIIGFGVFDCIDRSIPSVYFIFRAVPNVSFPILFASWSFKINGSLCRTGQSLFGTFQALNYNYTYNRYSEWVHPKLVKAWPLQCRLNKILWVLLILYLSALASSSGVRYWYMKWFLSWSFLIIFVKLFH